MLSPKDKQLPGIHQPCDKTNRVAEKNEKRVKIGNILQSEEESLLGRLKQ